MKTWVFILQEFKSNSAGKSETYGRQYVIKWQKWVTKTREQEVSSVHVSILGGVGGEGRNLNPDQSKT